MGSVQFVNAWVFSSNPVVASSPKRASQASYTGFAIAVATLPSPNIVLANSLYRTLVVAAAMNLCAVCEPH